MKLFYGIHFGDKDLRNSSHLLTLRGRYTFCYSNYKFHFCYLFWQYTRYSETTQSRSTLDQKNKWSPL